jgi:hydrogenase nickel incorporation protein HypA/HybF
MHELAICQALMAQLQQSAADHGEAVIERVVLSVGPLSGVEPALLQRAFEIARAGTVAGAAQLEIHTGQVRVHCRVCGGDSGAMANRLLCGVCGNWRVNVTAGEELLLLRLELSTTPRDPGQGARDAHPDEGNKPCAIPAAVP